VSIAHRSILLQLHIKNCLANMQVMDQFISFIEQTSTLRLNLVVHYLSQLVLKSLIVLNWELLWGCISE